MPEVVAAVAGLLAVLVVATGLILVRRHLHGPNRGRPPYLGPDATVVEPATGRLLNESRTGRGHEALTLDPTLTELARHHAHWMAFHRRCTPLDDQGRDVEARRRDLFEDHRGQLAQQELELPCEGIDEAGAARRLAEALGAGVWSDEGWADGGLGVSGTPGVLWVCVVVGRPPGEADGEP